MSGKVLRHAWVREGDPWPIEHPGSLKRPELVRIANQEVLHIAGHDEVASLDVWWIEYETGEEDSEDA